MKWWIVMVLVALALAWMAFVPMRRESAPVLGIAVANAEPTAEPAADMEGSSPDTDLAVARLSASELQGPEVDAPVESDGAGLPVAGAESQPPPAEPPPPRDFFPHGRPPPDWVFEQKYAGLSESAFALRKEEVAAAYGLASKRAFQECWDQGNFELIPKGQPQGLPNDDRIIGGRVLPGASETQVVRLNVDEYPEVYELFYEHLWLQTTPWKP